MLPLDETALEIRSTNVKTDRSNDCMITPGKHNLPISISSELEKFDQIFSC